MSMSGSVTLLMQRRKIVKFLHVASELNIIDKEQRNEIASSLNFPGDSQIQDAMRYMMIDMEQSLYYPQSK